MGLQVLRSGLVFDLLHLDDRVAAVTAMLHVYGMLCKLVLQAPNIDRRLSMHVRLHREHNTTIELGGRLVTKIIVDCDTFFATDGTDYATVQVQCVTAYVHPHMHMWVQTRSYRRQLMWSGSQKLNRHEHDAYMHHACDFRCKDS